MKFGVLGRNGFIGSNLVKKLKGEIYSYPRKDLDVLYFFGSPSSDIIFEENIDYAFKETINAFLEVIKFCRDNNIKLVYPSSGTVYNLNTPYSRCKAVLEQIHYAYGGNVLGLRIFAGYGYEESKGDYASVVYKFTKQMLNDERPIIYGDGNQTRDFVYIDDIVNSIIQFTPAVGIMDIGTGVNTSFNHIVGLLNAKLEKQIQPIYKIPPKTYIKDTPCKQPLKIYTAIDQGINKLLEQL